VKYSTTTSPQKRIEAVLSWSKLPYVLNRTATSKLSVVTLYESIPGRKPDLSVIQEIGGTCCAYNEHARTTLQNSDIEGWCRGIKHQMEAYYSKTFEIFHSNARVPLLFSIRFREANVDFLNMSSTWEINVKIVGDLFSKYVSSKVAQKSTD